VRMLRLRLASASVFFLLLVPALVACGNTNTEGSGATTPKNPSDDGGTAASSSTTTATTTAKGDADAGAAEHVFAGTTAEATSLISTAVDKKQGEIAVCIREFRIRKKMLRDKVAVSFGIDQDGRLLGVTSKGREDTELKACVQEALKTASFPRSHAGVIKVTKTYEELIQ
jgi:hypothetical protein